MSVKKNKNKCYSFISDYVIFSNRQMRVKIEFSLKLKCSIDISA